MKKLWLNIKVLGVVIVGISLYAIILTTGLLAGIWGSLDRRLGRKKRNE